MTPTEQDRELRNKVAELIAKDLFYAEKLDEFMQLILADRKKHELQARIDEQGRTQIGRTDPSPEIWVQLDGVGHPSSTQFERMRELKQELEEL